jgi:hypothetical protein
MRPPGPEVVIRVEFCSQIGHASRSVSLPAVMERPLVKPKVVVGLVKM